MEQAGHYSVENKTTVVKEQPLQGLQVMEFSHTIMGPCAGLLLADLGADVIKIEPAPGGDKTRQLHGFASGFFAAFNRNKRSVAVNLKTPEGQSVVHRLIEGVDIVIDNYGPGTLDKLGCGCDRLREINPALIFLDLKGYLTGPWHSRPALDEVVQFQSGLAYMTGPPGKPLRAGASVVDILGAVFGVTGVLAALRERDQSGLGQRVGSSLFESAAFLMAPHMIGGSTTGQTVPPMTARKGAWGIYDVFQSSTEEQLFIGVTSDAQWRRFCLEFSFDDYLKNQNLAENTQRTRARDWLIPDLRGRLAPMSIERLIQGCQLAEVSWSPIGRPEDLQHNEQLLANGGLLATALASAENAASEEIKAGIAQIPALPLEFGTDRKRPELRLQPPRIGEHTLSTLSSAGFSELEITRLKDQGVIVG